MRILAMTAWLAICYGEPGFASTVRVAATGDSLTRNLMLSGELDTALASRSTRYELAFIAYNGTTAPRYDGLEINPYTEQYDDFTQQTLALAPDVVTLMLGTNDAGRTNLRPDTFVRFVASMTHILDQYEAARVPLVLATPPPLLRVGDKYDQARVTLANDVLPWLRQQASRPNVYFLDVNERIQQAPNYESMYREVDLIHFNEVGNRWLAEQFRDGIESARNLAFPRHPAVRRSLDSFGERAVTLERRSSVPEPDATALAAGLGLVAAAGSLYGRGGRRNQTRLTLPNA